jgi:flagellar M-ring protein FliF
MNERLNQAKQKAVEFWNKYNRKQKTMMISITLAVIVMLIIMVFVFTRPSYVTLVECDSASTASDVKDALTDAGISYTISDSYVVKVKSEDKVEAEMAIAVSGVVAKEYTIDEALSGGMTTTEADKQKRYKAYLEDRLRVSIEKLDYVKAARVTITVPESKLSVLDSDEESTAAVSLNLKKSISSETAENMAQWIATSLGNETTASITIIDTQGNMLFRGTDYTENGYSGGSKSEMRQAAMDLVVTNVKKLFEAAELYQTIEVSPYLDMTFDTVERTEVTYDTGDREQGPYLTSYDVTQEGNSGASGVPGTDSNDEDITYDITTDENSSSSYELHKYEYAVNQIIETTTLDRGRIEYDDSTLGIVARTYNVYEEEQVRSEGLLADITWEQFKEQNRDNVQLEVPDELYELVSNATGFKQENISIVAYRVPQFIDAEETSSKGFTDYLPIILAVVIFALFAFVVFKSTRPVEVLESEPELSVEALLSSTKESQPVEDIDLNDKSDTRKAIEKFVDENPEAVALLLRNWLDDDWD